MVQSWALWWGLGWLTTSGEDALLAIKNAELGFWASFLCLETLWVGRVWRKRKTGDRQRQRVTESPTEQLEYCISLFLLLLRVNLVGPVNHMAKKDPLKKAEGVLLPPLNLSPPWSCLLMTCLFLFLFSFAQLPRFTLCLPYFFLLNYSEIFLNLPPETSFKFFY